MGCVRKRPGKRGKAQGLPFLSGARQKPKKRKDLGLERGKMIYHINLAIVVTCVP